MPTSTACSVRASLCGAVDELGGVSAASGGGWDAMRGYARGPHSRQIMEWSTPYDLAIDISVSPASRRWSTSRR
jgi:hypothetical protein